MTLYLTCRLERGATLTASTPSCSLSWRLLQPIVARFASGGGRTGQREQHQRRPDAPHRSSFPRASSPRACSQRPGAGLVRHGELRGSRSLTSAVKAGVVGDDELEAPSTALASPEDRGLFDVLRVANFHAIRRSVEGCLCGHEQCGGVSAPGRPRCASSTEGSGPRCSPERPRECLSA